MAYIQAGDEHIDPATPADLDRLFEESRIFGVAVHQDQQHAMQATVTGGSALVLYLDHAEVKARKPAGQTDRSAALQILKAYLEDGSLHSDYSWSDAPLPVVSTRQGCGSRAVVLFILMLVTIFTMI